MTVTIYGIKNCDTMKKAIRWLESHHISHEFHDYKKSGVPRDKLKVWLTTGSPERVINRRGTTWRKLSDSEKTLLNEHPMSEEALTLICDNPSLIKRPVLEAGNQLIIGFSESEYQARITTI